MGVANAAAAEQKLRMTRAKAISSGVVTIPEQKLGFKQGFLARDPDGHAVQLIEK
jgi:hypothetical protein